MKRFLIRIMSFIGIPAIALLAIFFATDPFKTMSPFSVRCFDDTNRDYLSSELFFRNDPVYHYNSFMFGSSRCMGFNTWHWKHYLPEGSRQFLFQSWGETLTGIEEKINFLDNNGNEIKNALLLIDIPGTFDKVQSPKTPVTIRHYKITGQSRLAYQACFFYYFSQKPSKWIAAVKKHRNPTTRAFPADTISNDFGRYKRFEDIGVQPPKEYLTSCTEKTRNSLLKQVKTFSDKDLNESKRLITNNFLEQLRRVKAVFDKHQTDYRIVVSPAYCYLHPSINEKDLQLLYDVFGKDKVFDYSGKNDITTDINNFADPNHFGPSVGWQIIEDMYNK